MFDRRTAAQREWSVWWRYAATLTVFEVVAFLVCLRLNGPSTLVGMASLFGLAHAVLQLAMLGIATAVLVRYHVRTFHVWVGAGAANLPLLIAPALPFAYWFPCYLVSVALAIAWTIIVTRISFSIADPRLGHLCKECFYDLRGLSSQVCPECGTLRQPDLNPLTSPSAAGP